MNNHNLFYEYDDILRRSCILITCGDERVTIISYTYLAKTPFKTEKKESTTYNNRNDGITDRVPSSIKAISLFDRSLKVQRATLIHKSQRPTKLAQRTGVGELFYQASDITKNKSSENENKSQWFHWVTSINRLSSERLLT